MGTPGFWDDQARAAASRPSTRAPRKLERYESLRREVDEAAELLELEPELEAESPSRSRPCGGARTAAGGGAVRRRVRRRRCRGDDHGRRRRHRRPGLGGDAAPHVPPLDGRPGFPDRGHRGEPGRGGGPQVRDGDGARRERLRAVQGGRRPPPRPALAVRLGASAPHCVRPGRGRAAASRQCGGRDRRERPADRHVPRQRRRRPARQQDRFGRPDHCHGDRRGARTSARRRPTSRRRCGSCARASPSSQRRSAKPSLRGSEAGRSTSGSAARSVRTSCTRTSRSRISARATRLKRAGRPRRRPRRLRAGLPARAGGRQGVAEAARTCVRAEGILETSHARARV